MNGLTKWILKGKLSRALRAEPLTGYRTQVCLAVYLIAMVVQVIGLQFGWDMDLLDAMDLIKEAAVGAGGLALAAKVTRSGPEAKKRLIDRIK